MDYVSSPSRLRHYLKDPRSVYYFFNKATRNPAIRGLLFRLVRLIVPKGNVTVGVDAEVMAIEKDGIIFWERFIDTASVKKIHNYLMTKQVHEVHDLRKKPLNLADIDPARQAKLKYCDTDIANSEEIMNIANDKTILSIVSAYFGCKPTIIIMEAWWTKAGPNGSDILFQDDMYHRDVADYKFIKLFIYLTDVVAENGAHCFVRGSHRSSALTERRPFADKDVERAFCENDLFTLNGEAGCGFLEDTWGLHRSLPAKKGVRLLLSITYSLTSFNPESPKAPVTKNTYGVDPYINRVYLTS